MIPKDELGLNFLTFISQLRKNPGKKPQTGNCPDWGSNPSLLDERQQCYLPAMMVVSFLFKFSHLKNFITHNYTTGEKNCNTFKDKFIALKIDVKVVYHCRSK